jgi:hypothetical protein
MTGAREKRGDKKGVLISKMPQVEFDWEAIREIKKRKKNMRKRRRKQKQVI